MSNAASRYYHTAMRARRHEPEPVITEADMVPVVEFDANGRIIAARIRSKSHPHEAPYELERSVAGNWMHTNSRCAGFTRFGDCYHCKALVAFCAEYEANQ